MSHEISEATNTGGLLRSTAWNSNARFPVFLRITSATVSSPHGEQEFRECRRSSHCLAVTGK